MKVYLDNSVLNRPFDDQSFVQIRLETIAFLFILALIEKKKIKLMNSSIIEYENIQNPFLERKIAISSYLSKAVYFQSFNEEIQKRAAEIEKSFVFPLDSLHLASAETAGVDYFITCDYDIIKRYKGILRVLNPIQFIQILHSSKA